MPRNPRAATGAILAAALAALPAASLGQTAPAAPAPAAPETATAAPPALEAAWRRFRGVEDSYRAKFLADPHSADPQLRDEGLYYLESQEVVARNLYVTPRQLYPALYTQAYFLPLELSWGMPNPDFYYRNGFIDGAHTYRVYGRINDARWATLQVSRGFWGDDKFDIMGNFDFDDVPRDKDGRFEIFLGPNPPADPHGALWVRTDPAAFDTFIATREVLSDWSRDKPLELHIEMLDRKGDEPIFYSADELAARVDRAGKYLGYAAEYALRSAAGTAIPQGDVLNTFHAAVNAQKEGGNPLGNWAVMNYALAPGEALVIEMTPVEARYWGIQLGTVWGQTIDYAYHQSSLSMSQARLDPDGRFRAVLSLTDPGVANWLDPAGNAKGSVVLRFYKSKGLAIPTVKVVKLADLARVLPASTAKITPAMRKAQLGARREAALARFGQ